MQLRIRYRNIQSDEMLTPLCYLPIQETVQEVTRPDSSGAVERFLRNELDVTGYITDLDYWPEDFS